MEPLAVLNGQPLPLAQASLALNDAGFVFGATITDLCRTFGRRLYRWSDHLARFRAGCRYAHIDLPFTDEDLTRQAEELLAHNAQGLGAGQELIVVLFATPGPIGYYLGQPGLAGERPTVGMHTFPLPFARYRPLIEQGAVLRVPGVRHVPPECIDPRIKQRSRLHWWLAEQEARQLEPGAQALLLDREGHVTETAAANFLVVQKGRVISPPAESVLAGVSLRVVQDLCEWEGIPFEQRQLRLAECQAADEALLASTPYGLAGVRKLDGIEIPWPGPVLRQLLAAWNAEVGLDLHRQILAS